MSTPANAKSVNVSLCADIEGMSKCPRCLRWTSNDGPEYPGSKEETGIICWRCQFTLCSDYPCFPITEVVNAWRESKGLPIY